MEKKYVSIILVLLLSGGTLQASGFKDGPFVGAVRGGDTRDADVAIGWRVVYEYTPHLSIELSLSHHRDDVAFLMPPPPYDATFRLETLGLALGGRIGHRFGRVAVYGTGGAGYYRMHAKAGSLHLAPNSRQGALPPGVPPMELSANVVNSPGYHAALGVEVQLPGKWEVFTEYRWIYLDTDITYRKTETFPDPDPATPDVRRETTRTKSRLDYDHHMIRFGVNRRF